MSARSGQVVFGIALLMGALAADVGAHRKDEYLQAARIALDPQRVLIELSLTPGVAVAGTVLADVDRDRSGTISADEAKAYAEVVRKEIRLEVDGSPLSTELVNSRFPPVESIRRGEGAITLRFAAAVPSLSTGPHHLLYRNHHRGEIAAYLANVLLPESASISISAQKRDVAQRQLVIDYVLR